jgi:hypothetical protein
MQGARLLPGVNCRSAQPHLSSDGLQSADSCRVIILAWRSGISNWNIFHPFSTAIPRVRALCPYGERLHTTESLFTTSESAVSLIHAAICKLVLGLPYVCSIGHVARLLIARRSNIPKQPYKASCKHAYNISSYSKILKSSP